MTLILIAPPAVEPVAPAELRAHLRLPEGSESELLAALVTAARQEVERQTGKALIEQGWRLCLDRWPPGGCVALRRTPVRAIEAVACYDRQGEPQALAGFEADLHSEPARLFLPDRPCPGPRLNGIEIDFRCGYGTAGPDVPDLLKRAILTLAAHWYEYRGILSPDSHPGAWPPAFDRLISTFRPARLQ